MKLTVNRFVDKKKDYTDGMFYFDGVYFCDTLEDPVRDHNKDGDLDDPGEGKVYGDTAIPYGIYKCMYTWSPAFKRFCLLIIQVNHFTGIRIHGVKTKKNTKGCIGVGEKIMSGQLKNGPAISKRLHEVVYERCVEKDEKGKPIEYFDKTYGRAYKLKEEITIQII